MATKKKSHVDLIKEAFGGDLNAAARELKKLIELDKAAEAKKLFKENGNKVPFHRWYKKEQYNYKVYAGLKGKITGYFKTVSGRYGGARDIRTFYKVHESGVMVMINQTMCKMGIVQGITSPANMQPSNKKEWDAVYKEFIKLVN